MPRYIDADELRCRVKTKTNPYGKPTLDYESGVKILDMIDNAPTADVVPKSEVESIITLNSQLEAQAFEQQKEIESLKKSIFPSYSQAIGEEAAIKIGEEYGKQEAKEEIQKLNVELDAMRGAANSLKMHYEKAEAEVRRLHSILLQFTDIVHKWGAKNNIDTTEISFVPILQKEADSIIKKANQELASEIFAEIEKIHLHVTNEFDLRRYEQLKKKYTECEPIPTSEEKYFSPEDVRKMTNQEVREKYSAIRKSMEMW